MEETYDGAVACLHPCTAVYTYKIGVLPVIGIWGSGWGDVFY